VSEVDQPTVVDFIVTVEPRDSRSSIRSIHRLRAWPRPSRWWSNKHPAAKPGVFLLPNTPARSRSTNLQSRPNNWRSRACRGHPAGVAFLSLGYFLDRPIRASVPRREGGHAEPAARRKPRALLGWSLKSLGFASGTVKSILGWCDPADESCAHTSGGCRSVVVIALGNRMAPRTRFEGGTPPASGVDGV